MDSNLEDIELLEHAAALLDAEALSLRECHNLNHTNPDWNGEPEAKEAHDDCKNTSTRLYALADRMKAALASPQPAPDPQDERAADDAEEREAFECECMRLYGKLFFDPPVQQAKIKYHVIREAINQLRDIAVKYHAHGCLRELISRVVVPLLKGEAVQQEAPCPACYPNMGIDHTCGQYGTKAPRAEAQSKCAYKRDDGSNCDCGWPVSACAECRAPSKSDQDGK